MNMPTGTKIAVGALVVIVGGTIIYTWTSTPTKKSVIVAPSATTPSDTLGALPAPNSTTTLTPGFPNTGPSTLTLTPNATTPTPIPNAGNGAPTGVPAARPFVEPRLTTNDTGKGDFPSTNAANPASGNGSTLVTQNPNGYRNGYPVPTVVQPANGATAGNTGTFSPSNTTGPRPVGTTPTNPTNFPPANPTTASNSGESNYTVASGDTLGGIAKRLLGSESKWTVIAKANPSIDPNRMKVGTKLRIPSSDTLASSNSATGNSSTRPIANPTAATSNTSASAASGNYVVVAGDTLSKIARKSYGDSKLWQKIYTANKGAIGNDPANIRVGMKLTIPTAGAIAGVRTDS
ncbi:MAG: LysM peptidoglycan-binding domain-containing protein [Phycisphaerales bacterium]|nr:LysM peptidoglycan-binding domain-containing protein [Phycisphaerales bacterium]